MHWVSNGLSKVAGWALYEGLTTKVAIKIIAQVNCMKLEWIKVHLLYVQCMYGCLTYLVLGSHLRRTGTTRVEVLSLCTSNLRWMHPLLLYWFSSLTKKIQHITVSSKLESIILPTWLYTCSFWSNCVPFILSQSSLLFLFPQNSCCWWAVIMILVRVGLLTLV